MDVAINQRMGRSEWAMLLGLSALWGGSFFFVEIAVAGLPPLSIVTLRVGLAAAALWTLVALRGLPLPSQPALWSAFFFMGLLNNAIPFSLIVWAQTQIASGLASILNATTPLFTVLAAGLLLPDERITRRKLAGVFCGFLGVTIMIGPAALGEIGADVPAQLAVLGAALSYALAAVFGRRFKRFGIDPVVTAAGQVTASCAMLAPLALAIEQPFALSAPQIHVWAAIGALALLSTALAYILYFRLLASSGATNLLLVTFLIPVSAILLGVLVLGETLQAVHLAGMAMIGLGLSAIDGRLWKAVARPRRA